MQEIHSENELRDAIEQLERKQEMEGKMLKAQFHVAYESVKPVNLIKSTLKEVEGSQDLKDNLINTTIGITAGYISKRMFEGVSHAPLRKLLGTAVMFGVTNVIAKNPEVIKSVSCSLFSLIRSGLETAKVNKSK